VVLEINGNAIFAKSGLNRPDDYKFFNFLRTGGDDEVEFFEKLLTGSKEAGISAEKVVIYFSELPNYTIIVPIVDRNAFEGWVKKSFAEPQAGKGFYYLDDGDFRIVWNDNLASFSTPPTGEQTDEQLKPKKNGLLATNSDFQQFAKKNADIRLWFKYGSVMNFYSKMMLMHGITQDKLFPGQEEMTNISAHSYLDYEDGKIVGTSNLYPPEEIEKLQKKFPVFKKNFDSDILKDMPEQSYFAFNVFVNINEYLKIVRQGVESMLPNIDESELTLRSAEMFGFFDSPQLKSVVEALKGDMLLSIHGFNKGIFTYPLASAVFTVNGEDAFKNILELLPKDIYREQGGYYTISVSDNVLIPVYFAYRDSRIFVSNDVDAVKAFTEGRQGKTFADNPVTEMMKDKMVVYFNLDFDSYPENLKMLIQNLMGHEYKMFTSAISIYERMYISTSMSSMEFSLQLKNKNVNSLKQILKNIDKTFSSAWTN
jgi:hypothetical protein